MQKSSIKLLLKKNKKNKLGLLPIYLRVTINRRTVFASTGHYIQKKDWDEKTQTVRPTHPMQEQINLDITIRKKEALESIIHAGIKKQSVSAATVKETTELGDKKTDIFNFKDRLIKELSSKRSEGTFENWHKHLRKLKAFNRSPSLSFQQITPAYLNDFERYLRSEGVNHREGRDTGNYVFAIMNSIRSLFNYAKGKELITVYPFGDNKYEMPEQTIGDKAHLSISELDRWEQYVKEVEDPMKKQAALYFLLGCYTGLRISDWYLFDIKKRVHKDYISVRATKNGQWINTPIYNRLGSVISMIKQTPLTHPEPVINRTFKAIAKDLKIDKSISSHCARKTFAVTICLERGVSSETAAELMGITLAVFVKSYSRITPAKIRLETSRAWDGL
jgi:site-specific recombinase XerD